MENNKEFQQAIEQLNQQTKKINDALLLAGEATHLKREWLPRYEVMKYLGYADTQMSAIAKQYKIASTQIGKRIFYKTSSILAALDKNQILSK